jgi:hypothetical protein
MNCTHTGTSRPTANSPQKLPEAKRGRVYWLPAKVEACVLSAVANQTKEQKQSMTAEHHTRIELGLKTHRTGLQVSRYPCTLKGGRNSQLTLPEGWNAMRHTRSAWPSRHAISLSVPELQNLTVRSALLVATANVFLESTRAWLQNYVCIVWVWVCAIACITRSFVIARDPLAC